MGHKVTVRKRRHKWAGSCTCGWGCLSWSWSRAHDLLMSGMTKEAYLAEGNGLEGGALIMALDHVAGADS